MIDIRDIKHFGTGHQLDMTDMGIAAGGGLVGGGTMTMDRFNHYGEHMDAKYVDGGMMLGQGQYSQYSGGAFDGMALSSEFLGEYYSNVSKRNSSKSAK